MWSKLKVCWHFSLRQFFFFLKIFLVCCLNPFFFLQGAFNNYSPLLVQPESPLKYFEFEEMAEQLIEDDGSSWKHELSGMPASPPPFKTPRSLNHFTPWKDCDLINFKLMETPEVTKN